MVSTTTTNKTIEKPASGDYVNAWAAPVNVDWDIVDTSFGGTTTLNAVAASGTVALTVTQYRPPNIVVSGALTANVNYQLPTGVGGFWTVSNATSGTFTITFSSAGGGTTVAVRQGYRTVIGANGTDVFIWSTTPQLAAGSTTQIQYSNGTDFAGSSDFTWNNSSKLLTINGNVLLTAVTPTITYNSGGPRTAVTAANRWSVFKDGNPIERLVVNAGGFTEVYGDRTDFGTGFDIPGNGALLIAASTAGVGTSTFSFLDYTPHEFVRQISGINTVVGSITSGVSGTAYNTTSDYRLKTTHGPLTGALDRICAVPLYHGSMRAQPGVTTPMLLAHELQAVSPHAVTGEKDGDAMQQVDYSKMVVDLMGAVQELRAMVEKLI